MAVDGAAALCSPPAAAEASAAGAEEGVLEGAAAAGACPAAGVSEGAGVDDEGAAPVAMSGCSGWLWDAG